MSRWLGIAALLLVGRAHALQLHSLKVARTDKQYQLMLDVSLAAKPDSVWQVLTDYQQLHRLSERIILSRIEQPGEIPLVRTQVHACVLFMCRDVTQMQLMQKLAHYELQATMQAEGSDFSSGLSYWKLSAEGTGTRLWFRARFTPSFWVPPVVGPWAIQRSLKQDALQTAERLEQTAQQAEQNESP
ncbi:MAG: SRPBCC family protein [gamma proteobacterium symbiont of Bathyaustriella thionipta]|nr:SRPBCC family protein [gamma proteobacterium symbiont of Bathyaustriella thionipta]